MDSKKLSIKKIEIETFKKIKNLTVEPSDGANIFFGSFRSGKTSLCEFIQFILYGADSVSMARHNTENAMGKIVFSHNQKQYLVERSVINGRETVSFVDAVSKTPIETQLTPGEYLTGMDQDSFDLITYFKQARYQTPFFKPRFSFLNYICSLKKETENIYREELSLKEKTALFHNGKGTGSLDLLQQECNRLQAELDDAPKWERKIRDCNKSLKEIAEKLEENDKRCVLLKADMAGFADDLKLSRNKENAEELRKSILAKEKNLRIASYDVTHKIGLLSEEELELLKNDYNSLSLSVASLSEARTTLTVSEETLAFHQKIFSGSQNRTHYEKEKKRITGLRVWKTLLRILGFLILGGAGCLYLLLNHLAYEKSACIAASGSVFLLGLAAQCISLVLSGSIKKILAENGHENLRAFYDFYETICAHDRTTQLYRDKIRAAEELCEEKERRKEEVTQRIFEKISDLGYSRKDGEILAICDQIIEANDALYDLKAEIQKEENEYQRLLRTDVEKQSLTVSPEFSALQKELSFLSVQNDSLYKKKALLSKKLEEAQSHLSQDFETVEEKLIQTKEKMAKQAKKYEMLEMQYSLAKSNREQFETALKQTLTESIHQKTSFLLREGESFRFDENFEICYCDGNSVLPLINAGGGMISEMGVLALRLSLAELMGKNRLPMIFDDSFSSLSPESAKAFFKILQNTCSQFFIATSSETLANTCSDSATVISLG